MIRSGTRIIICLFFLTTLFTKLSTAQDITGIWRGYFVTNSHETYKLEMQLIQNGNALSGVSYSYHNVMFYGKCTISGIFNRVSKHALVKEIKTVEVKMLSISPVCLMKYKMKYSESGPEQYLEGEYSSIFEKTGMGAVKGENCGGGHFFMRKVNTSDFYVEPFLRNKTSRVQKKVFINQPPQKKNEVAKIPAPKKPPVITPKKNLPPVKKIETPENPKTEPPVKKIEPPVKKTEPHEEIPTPEVIKNRSNELVRVITVHHPKVNIKIYDNGEIDGDIISVYLDKKLIISHKTLTASPISFSIDMDDVNNQHELTMVAENLGSIPPNTSLMIVEAGDQRFEVRITSTEQKNAVVQFRYQPKE